MEQNTLPEPWLRGTHGDVPAVLRAVLHSLELAQEDLERWCGDLTNEELNASPAGLPPLAFQIRHIARSIDRLLGYAEGHPLNPQQLAVKEAEGDADAKREDVFAELKFAMESAAARIRALDVSKLEEPIRVGREGLPSSLGGLIVHVADHTQRHVGQAITTAKVVLAQRSSPGPE